jgi:hypothetical protein
VAKDDVKGSGRTPGPYSFKEAKELTDASWLRDGNRRSWAAILRHMYRTGKYDPTVRQIDMSRPIWDRTARNDWDREMLGTNFARQYIDIMVSSLGSRLPEIAFDPAYQAPEAVEAADAISSMINGFLDLDEAAEKGQAVIRDSRILGHGFAHVKWHRRSIKMTSEQHERLVEDAKKAFVEQMAAQGFPNSVPPAGFEDAIPDEQVVENRPTIEYVSPANILLPQDIRVLDETPWYGIVRYLRLSELRGDDMYDQEAVEHLVPLRDANEDSVSRKDPSSNEQSVDPLVKVVFFYDRQAKRLLVFGESGSKPLYDGEDQNAFNDMCLIDLRAHYDGEQFFGFGDLEGIAGLLDKAGLATRQQVLNLTNQGPTFVTWQDVLATEDEAKIRSAKPYDLIKLSPATHDAMREKFGDGVQPNQAISQLVTTTPLPADVFNVKSQLKDDAAEIAGVSEFMRGGLGPSRMPGTAAAAAEGWTTVRMSLHEQAVNRFWSKIATLFLRLCQQYLTEDDVVRMTGPLGESWQETVDAQRLSGDFFVRIRTGSASASNPSARAQRGRELMAVADQMEDRGYDVTGLRDIALRDLGIDPRQARLTKLQPQQPAPQQMPATPQPGMEEMMMGQQAAPRDQMIELGAPPTAGESGQLAY